MTWFIALGLLAILWSAEASRFWWLAESELQHYTCGQVHLVSPSP